MGASVGLSTPGTVAGRECQLTVDTGSNITLVRSDVLQRPGPEVTVQAVASRLQTVTGETAPILGTCRVQLAVGSYEATHDLWVADIADECILHGFGLLAAA